jgi:hypothetical protein
MATPAFTPNIASALRSCIDNLSKLPVEVERKISDIGDRLTQVIRTLGSAHEVMDVLGQKLNSSDLRLARDTLSGALREMVELVDENGAGPKVLDELCRLIDLAATRLASIQRVVGEISALAINAKVEAACIQQTGVDFSVFTTEISRLRSEAEHSLGLCLASVAGLSSIIHQALTSKTRFEESRSSDLAIIHERLSGSHSRLIQHDQKTARMIDDLIRRAGDLSNRVESILSTLHNNAVAGERLGQTTEGLKNLVSIVEQANGSDRSPDDKTALTAAAAARLHAALLARAGGDFEQEVEAAVSELAKLAEAARKLAAEGEDIMAEENGDSQTSFAATVNNDCERALLLLKEFGEADAEVQDAIRSVASRFEAMARDIEELNSIEVEMRIMGLNATFKCGRLGAEGRTLAVIAQELRVYSRRTGEEASAVFKVLTEAAEIGSRLSGETSTEREQAVHRIGVDVRGAMETLVDVGRTLSETISDARDGGHKAAGLLAETTKSITIHRHVISKLQDICAELNRTADRIDPERHDPTALQNDVARMLKQNVVFDADRGKASFGHTTPYR